MAFYLYSAGSFVTLHSLKARQDLNNRFGIVLRAADPSAETPRHNVYLPEKGGKAPTVVRAKAKILNLTLNQSFRGLQVLLDLSIQPGLS